MADALQMYIDGRFVDALDGERFDVFNPSTGEVIATAPRAKVADVDLAVTAARRTFDDGSWWPAIGERDRGRILLRAAEIMRREAERLARLETADCGKPYAEALDDVNDAAYMFEYYGGWTTKIVGDIPPVGNNAMSLVVKEPIGVAAAITPWNYPILMAVQKVAPALAAGCTLILKPPEQTPLTCLELPKILEEAGLPAGVFHVITGMGEEAGAPLVEDRRVDKVGFTGSLEVGKIIMRAGADTLKRVTLELGGKSPNIFFADAEFEAAVEGACNGVFWNQGEICSAGTRVFVERPVYDDAVAAMIEHAKGVVLGDPMHPDTVMGPLVSKEQQERVKNYIEVGKNEANLAILGETPTDPKLANGYYVPPAIFTDATNDIRISREEIFGPVMTVIPFDTVEEVIAASNDNDYGLAAAVWTKDITKAFRTAKALRAGTVWINDTQPAPTEAPWGGMKQSGIGRELGPWSMDDYLELKHIWVNLGD